VEKVAGVLFRLMAFERDALLDLDTKAYADAVAGKLAPSKKPEDKHVRQTALQALRGLKATAHAADAAACLADPDMDIRNESAETLGTIAGKDQAPALIQFLASDSGDYRKSFAIKALDRIEPRGAKTYVQRAADAGDANAKTALEKWPKP
jgi:HEAT repeat protein